MCEVKVKTLLPSLVNQKLLCTHPLCSESEMVNRTLFLASTCVKQIVQLQYNHYVLLVIVVRINKYMTLSLELFPIIINFAHARVTTNIATFNGVYIYIYLISGKCQLHRPVL